MHFNARSIRMRHKAGRRRPLPGGNSLSYYRLYRLSAPGGRFIGFEEIEAADDAEAQRRAAEFAGERPLELWCGSRKVLSIPAAAPAAATRTAS